MNAKTANKSGNSLINNVKSMAGAPVLVVGDIMLDRFVYGGVDRISPESPVPVLSVQREDEMLGGAGNALANLAGLGASGAVLSIIGDDAEGKRLSALAKKQGLDISGLIVEPSRPTIVKTRFLAGHQQLLRTDFERCGPVSDALAKEILKRADGLVKKSRAVILSDYGKGLLRVDVISGIIEIARKNNIPVVVDPKGKDFSIYKGATAVTPNKKELADATRGMAVNSDEEIISAAQTIINECAIDAVVATRSRDGLSIIQKNVEPVHYRGADIEVFDVSGAGDTVIATIAAALAGGADLATAGALANVAGSIVVAKVGTAPIRAEELMAALEGGTAQTRIGSRQAPLMEWSEAAEQIRRWRARNLKVGFTNGCFDILHFGHVSYLNEARNNCDRLIVALNCDSSVKILKGADRPVHDENSRAAVLGALGSIDMVVLFGAKKSGDDNTACDLLAELQPDIYFKGGDYTVDQIPEAPTVQAYGGKVSVMPVFEGHSTTSSLKKIKTEAA